MNVFRVSAKKLDFVLSVEDDYGNLNVFRRRLSSPPVWESGHEFGEKYLRHDRRERDPRTRVRAHAAPIIRFRRDVVLLRYMRPWNGTFRLERVRVGEVGFVAK